MNKTLVSMLCAAALLTACGGGDDSAAPPPATQQVPATVNSSVPAFISYLMELVASAADALEPVDITAVTPATDDAAEPTAVN